ncbi:hypothetical protein SRABI04_01956 [Chryseobacterium sp. Bi04]|nr:hypothetical protein SRABI04_01956 [Chryseobacterium sp. Bi04]
MVKTEIDKRKRYCTDAYNNAASDFSRDENVL